MAATVAELGNFLERALSGSRNEGEQRVKPRIKFTNSRTSGYFKAGRGRGQIFRFFDRYSYDSILAAWESVILVSEKVAVSPMPAIDGPWHGARIVGEDEDVFCLRQIIRLVSPSSFGGRTARRLLALHDSEGLGDTGRVELAQLRSQYRDTLAPLNAA